MRNINDYGKEEAAKLLFKIVKKYTTMYTLFIEGALYGNYN